MNAAAARELTKAYKMDQAALMNKLFAIHKKIESFAKVGADNCDVLASDLPPRVIHELEKQGFKLHREFDVMVISW